MGGELAYERKHQAPDRKSMAESSRQVRLYIDRAAARDVYLAVWLLEYAVYSFPGRRWAVCWLQCRSRGQYLAEHKGLYS